MEVRSVYKYARISPLKARDVAREIQGMPVSSALEMLQFTPKKSAVLIEKTLKSAIANAENNHDLMPDTLVVRTAMVGEGPSFRRFKPRARGSAAPIQKRTSHITIIVTDEIELPEPKQKRGKAKTKPKTGSKPAPKSEPEALAEVEDTAVIDETATAETAIEDTATVETAVNETAAVETDTVSDETAAETTPAVETAEEATGDEPEETNKA